jgi:ABC-type uncharacterized transport system permease subunit
LLAAVAVAAIVGGLMGLIHAFMTISLHANQIVSGLALTIFGGAIGLSSYFGQIASLGGVAGRHQFEAIDLFGLGHLATVWRSRRAGATDSRPALAGSRSHS